jgi:hypothetical protein
VKILDFAKKNNINILQDYSLICALNVVNYDIIELLINHSSVNVKYQNVPAWATGITGNRVLPLEQQWERNRMYDHIGAYNNWDEKGNERYTFIDVCAIYYLSAKPSDEKFYCDVFKLLIKKNIIYHYTSKEIILRHINTSKIGSDIHTKATYFNNVFNNSPSDGGFRTNMIRANYDYND